MRENHALDSLWEKPPPGCGPWCDWFCKRSELRIAENIGDLAIFRHRNIELELLVTLES